MSADADRAFLEHAPTTAAEAARIILDGVRNERWRILVGEDAHMVDAEVRASPEEAYEPAFMQRLGTQLLHSAQNVKIA